MTDVDVDKTVAWAFSFPLAVERGRGAFCTATFLIRGLAAAAAFQAGLLELAAVLLEDVFFVCSFFGASTTFAGFGESCRGFLTSNVASARSAAVLVGTTVVTATASSFVYGL